MNGRRWPIRIIICLALGAVTTVGVAWGFTVKMWSEDLITTTPISRQNENGNWWLLRHHTGCGRSWVWSYRIRPVVPKLRGDPPNTEMVPEWTGFGEPTPAFVNREIDDEIRLTEQTGWPMPALRCRYEYDVEMKSAFFRVVGIDLDAMVRPGQDRLSLPRVLPITPAPIGFAIDTLVYATAWVALIFAPGTFKRWNRRRRGRCPKCNYDLRGNPEGVIGCAECGWGRES